MPSPLRPLENPPNPWATTDVEYLDGEAPAARLEVYEDHSRGILSHNDSPDVGFAWSVNPYRGCFHACAYCYARPSHEYLSFGAGTDFERKIVVKKHAARLLREAFDAPKWKGELVSISGVTDCYLPPDARMPRGLHGVQKPRGDHHEGASGRARHRCAARPCARGPCVD